MAVDTALLFAFLTVFVRCSAMLLASPVFGAQNTPLQVRVFITLAISGALTLVIKPSLGPVPVDLGSLFLRVLNEAAAGILLGLFMTFVLQAAQIAGALLDVQIGLGISQAMNPLTGISSTVISQFKFMLAVVVYLSVDAHHLMIAAFAKSYATMPSFGLSSLPEISGGIVRMLGTTFLIALQIALPVLAVSLVVDAALGFVNKAVPQMQAMQLAMPAKVAVGFVVLGFALPAVASGVHTGVDAALHGLAGIFHAH